MKKITVKWKPERLVSCSHPGCCKQDGGCGKKHG